MPFLAALPDGRVSVLPNQAQVVKTQIPQPQVIPKLVPVIRLHSGHEAIDVTLNVHVSEQGDHRSAPVGVASPAGIVRVERPFFRRLGE